MRDEYDFSGGLRGQFSSRVHLTDEERQLLLKAIDGSLLNTQGRIGGYDLPKLIAIRRKLEGVDKRITVETGK
jgi:hypothetical protein